MFIGNSLTDYNALWDKVKKHADDNGYTVRVDHVAHGGYWPDRFLDPAEDIARQLDQKLRANNNDFAYIQGNGSSACSDENIARFEKGVRDMYQKLTDGGAKQVLLYETFAQKGGEPDHGRLRL